MMEGDIMKKSLHIILALCIGLLIGTTGTSLASDTVQATFQKFNLTINGQNTIEIEPLAYKGTAYLPVRETSTMLGYDVAYEAESRTIVLNSLDNGQVLKMSSDADYDELKRIKFLITTTKEQIDKFTADASNPNQHKDNREFSAKVAEQYKRTIADLERQKAELEARMK